MTVSLDIASFITTATYVVLFFAVYGLWRGRRAIRESGELPYHRLRQQRLLSGWRTIFWGLVLGGVAAWFHFYGEATAFSIIPVTATPSATAMPTIPPTPSETPTETLTPSETPTLQFTYTPAPTPIPQLPADIQSQFSSEVTPNPDAVFSEPIFARGVNFQTYLAVDAGTVFPNPIHSIYATFSYDKMLPNVQWSALWYRNGELVHYETKPWDGGTGGYGYAEYIANAEDWLPGTYQLQIFVGTEIKVVGEFQVTGVAATSSVTPTFTPTASRTPTATAKPTRTPTPTASVTNTRAPTATEEK